MSIDIAEKKPISTNFCFDRNRVIVQSFFISKVPKKKSPDSGNVNKCLILLCNVIYMYCNFHCRKHQYNAYGL